MGQGFVIWVNSSKAAVKSFRAEGKENRVDRDIRASHGLCPHLGLTVIGSDALRG